ncbi:MAG: transglutaminase domain-containing protein [Bacillota bacterium]
MKKTFRIIRSIAVCCLVLGLLGMVVFAERSETPTSPAQLENKTEMTLPENAMMAAGQEQLEASGSAAENSSETAFVQEKSGQNDSDQNEPDAEREPSPVGTGSETASLNTNPAPVNNSPTDPSPVQHPPAAAPSPPSQPPSPPSQPASPPPAAPVTYVWGGSHTFQFRAEVQVTNTGSDLAQGVVVHLPMLENSSPYQNTVLQSTNYAVVSTSGRVSSFNIGDLQPQETKVLTVDYTITVRPVSINSTNATVDKARQAYNQFAGSGNCLTLATGFVNKCRELGLTARVVNGFTRPQRAHMTAGSLQGYRHSWGEFFVDGLGWVPVDLTFQYFGNFPYASHIVETYSDQSIRVNYLGGTLSVNWQNRVL